MCVKVLARVRAVFFVLIFVCSISRHFLTSSNPHVPCLAAPTPSNWIDSMKKSLICNLFSVLSCPCVKNWGTVCWKCAPDQWPRPRLSGTYDCSCPILVPQELAKVQRKRHFEADSLAVVVLHIFCLLCQRHSFGNHLLTCLVTVKPTLPQSFTFSS